MAKVVPITKKPAKFFERREWHSPPATNAYDFGDDCGTSEMARRSGDWNAPRSGGGAAHGMLRARRGPMARPWGVMLKHIAIVRFIACSCLVASAAVAAGEEPFVGSWRLDGGSMAVPENCARMTARFVDGQYEGDDGYMVLRLRYVVENHEGKFLLRFSYLSDNDVSNCQGLSPEHVRRNILRSALIEVLDPNRLKVHYGETEQAPYLTFVRDR